VGILGTDAECRDGGAPSRVTRREKGERTGMGVGENSSGLLWTKTERSE